MPKPVEANDVPSIRFLDNTQVMSPLTSPMQKCRYQPPMRTTPICHPETHVMILLFSERQHRRLQRYHHKGKARVTSVPTIKAFIMETDQNRSQIHLRISKFFNPRMLSMLRQKIMWFPSRSLVIVLKNAKP